MADGVKRHRTLIHLNAKATGKCMLQPSGTYIRLYDWTVNTELSWLDSMAVASVRSNMRHGRTSTRRLFLILRNNSHQWQPSARCSLWITIRKRVYWYITLEAIWYHATVVIAVPTKVILSLHAHCTGFRATLNYYIIFLVPHMKMCNFIFGLVVYLFSFFFSFLCRRNLHIILSQFLLRQI